jgi:hypothetical protein
MSLFIAGQQMCLFFVAPIQDRHVNETKRYTPYCRIRLPKTRLFSAAAAFFHVAAPPTKNGPQWSILVHSRRGAPQQARPASKFLSLNCPGR